ncbi:MAG: VIT and VWA domain-containing protein, partial [Myxococcota bacterium]
MSRWTQALLSAALLCACTPTGTSTDEPSARERNTEGARAFDDAGVTEVDWTPIWEDEPPAPKSAGIGSLEVTGSTDLSRQLDLASLDVQADVVGNMVAFEVEHRFDNPSEEVLEGTFRFPLPAGAVVTGLAMEIDGELMEGEVLDRDRAREIYQSIVDSMQDPALLEWEQGRTFKLRVFPIEAGSEKRVVIRYLAPLHRVLTRGGERWEIVVPTAAPAMQGEIGHLSVRVDGQTVADEDHARPVGAIRVALATPPADVVQQQDEHGTFTAVRIRPDWTEVPAPAPSDGTRRLLVVVDTSRSAMEAWGLTRESLRIVLESLTPDDEVCVVAADITARAHAPTFLPATDDEIAAALAFIDDIEPDGASDLSAALTHVSSILADAEDSSAATQVLVLGDGVPTWGETDGETLLAAARGALGETPLHGLVLGRGADGALLRRIAGTTGGRVERPESSEEIEWFAGFLGHAPTLRRLRDVELQAEGVDAIAGFDGGTIFEGQAPLAYMRTAQDAPVEVQLAAKLTDAAVVQSLPLPEAKRGGGVRKIWAAETIEALEADKSRRAEVIAMSETHGVLSRHTAFLVLESEEAYRE